ncbi:hypothetical protein BDQ12DRAFT_666725 [Crucibulum laeve]|uniref:Uncharacterized protein n=1 Tax=Crucibulum laeve TaxID=68775 RepID=A0A5C3M9J0_9AGAR|nr:hypothetical protein BDQ12DRAFT_666725 [Crucibulum laeve]
MTTPLRIDDRDSSIVYSPSDWIGIAGSEKEFDLTLMEALGKGATSQLQFTVPTLGTSIAVFGTILASDSNIQGNPLSTYSIDDQLVTTFAPSEETFRQHNVLFYRSATLPQGIHILLVTSLGNKSTFYVDYFEVTGDSSTTGSPISTSLLSTPTMTSSSTPAATSPLTLSTSSTSSSSLSTGTSSKKTSYADRNFIQGYLDRSNRRRHTRRSRSFGNNIDLFDDGYTNSIIQRTFYGRWVNAPTWKAWRSTHTIKHFNVDLIYVGSGIHSTVEPFYLAMSELHSHKHRVDRAITNLNSWQT